MMASMGLVAAAIACTIAVATAQQSQLTCEDLYCRATGTTGTENLTYPYTVPAHADYYLYIRLTSRRGDVDL